MMNTNEQRELLGTIETVIAGRQHYGVRLARGERLRFSREPDNAHDRNAVRVLNGAREQAGYLPRRIVSWLTPLLDAKTITIEGSVSNLHNARPDIRPIDLRVSVGANGRDLLMARSKPARLSDALHNLIVQGHADAKSWDDPLLIREFGKRMWHLGGQELAPESRLLLWLLPGIAREKETRIRQRAAEEARESLLALKIGSPVGWGNLQLFPLVGRNGQTRDYTLLSEAIGAGEAEVREVSDAGRVPELMVVNRGERPIIIPEGEILTGAKQNRVVNITILVAAKSELIIPVSCVERGRWSSVSPGFRATHFAPPRARARKCASVCAERHATGQRQSDQGGVWENVAEYMDRAGASSRTESLTDAYEQAQGRLKSYRENVSLPEEAIGAVVAVSGKVVGLEVFDTHETLAGLWERLSEAYFFEAATNPEQSCVEVTEQDAQRFLESVAASLVPVDEPMGAGTELEVNAEGIAGSALWHGNRVLHAAAFDCEPQCGA
jgi:hypothetical protein